MKRFVVLAVGVLVLAVGLPALAQEYSTIESKNNTVIIGTTVSDLYVEHTEIPLTPAGGWLFNVKDGFTFSVECTDSSSLTGLEDPDTVAIVLQTGPAQMEGACWRDLWGAPDTLFFTGAMEATTDSVLNSGLHLAANHQRLSKWISYTFPKDTVNIALGAKLGPRLRVIMRTFGEAATADTLPNWTFRTTITAFTK